MITVAEAIARALATYGVRQVFGVVGSGNFHVTNALIQAGARYVAARHEAGAATMADAYARMSGEVTAVTLHQGCGLTNAMTGIAEAAKSRTPLLVIAAEVTSPASNFFVDQPALASAVGAESVRVTAPSTALADTARAYALAANERRTVLLNLPLEVQSTTVSGSATPPTLPNRLEPPVPADTDVTALTSLLREARRPVIVAGRGARHARAELLELAEACDALVATSAVVKGLFNGSPWSLDVSGGFASPLAAELIENADVVAGFGCALNHWTTRRGRLIGTNTRVAQVDVDPAAIGRHQRATVGVTGDAAQVARAVSRRLTTTPRTSTGYRSTDVYHRIHRQLRWRDLPFDDWGTGDGANARIDPRALTIALDDLLPVQRVVAVDSGNFMGYPSMFLSVPDEFGFCFTQAFQSIGLGLSTAIGAALARPDRLPVAALGDGGALMAAAELDTVRRLGLPMVVVVYNDAAYGAEVHHFTGEPLSTVTFPDTDVAAIATGYGFESVTVRRPADLMAVTRWLDGHRDRPLLVDAKVAAPRGSWWLEDAFS